jgi:alcohol dehydrogenase (cytochrome c)
MCAFSRCRAGFVAALLLAGLVGIPLHAQVSYERIKRAEAEPGNWLTYSGNYFSHRHSRLNEINASNVSRLRPAWTFQTGVPGRFQTSPLVVDGIVYITVPPSNVVALDARTGRSLWRYRRAMPEALSGCCGRVNRGVAILHDTIYVGTFDAHLVALDAKTGQVRWDVAVADPKTGHSITGAPLALDDKIVVGISGGEYGVRGFLDAYDAKSGARAWRFWTVPGPGEKGHETWEGDSWKRGAAPTWITGAYDPDLNLVYWGTGNPGPDWNGDSRPGDNLYSNSVIALDAGSGQLKWHFQFTPHDLHDWDSTQTPVLVDQAFRGEPRKLMLFANRNAFYYVLDRTSGEFLSARPYAKQTWAKELDPTGRPIRLPNTKPSNEGTKVYPGVWGGVNWWSPSYSPPNKLFYLATSEAATLYYKGDVEYQPGAQFLGGGARYVSDDDLWGAVRALEPETGEIKWEFRLHSPAIGGVLSTAGGLVFSGAEEGDFFALDAANGKALWRYQTGGAIHANPISYESAGRQFVMIAAGQSLVTFSLDGQ